MPYNATARSERLRKSLLRASDRVVTSGPTTRTPFPSQSRVARIELAECDLVRSAVTSVLRRGDGEAFVEPFAGGVATYAGPGSPLNKVVGLGFAEPVTPQDLDRVEARFAAVKAPVQVELSSLADPTVGELLTQRGYRLVAMENVLGRSLSDEDAKETPTAGEIAVSHADGMEAWMSILIEGFAAPNSGTVPAHDDFPREALEKAMHDMAGASGFVRYLATLDGEMAGAASVRLDGEIAQLTGSATRPTYRRRGVQTALLAARFADAVRSGCKMAVITTQPGSASHSNVHRAGFELMYLRAILRREPSAG